jgi:hypothetical protein
MGLASGGRICVFRENLCVLIASRRLLLNADRRSKFSDSSKKFQFLVASPERRIRARVDGDELDLPIRKGGNSLYLSPFKSLSPKYDPQVLWEQSVWDRNSRFIHANAKNLGDETFNTIER